jgi:Bor protein
MHAKGILGLAALLLTGACYRVTVNTGAPPSPTVIDKQWQLSFVYGLVPPPELNAREGGCAQGVASVVTERSFLNGLVGAITYSIFTPMHTKVTCASGPVAR